MLAISRACTSFERVRDILIAAIDRRDSRTCLDAFVELCELHLDATGGTLRTETYRNQLDVLRARVELEPVLRALPTPTKETPLMSYDLETAMPCLVCDHPGHVRLVAHRTFQCTCTHCYDGTEDATYIEQISGVGETPEAAVADWAGSLQEALGAEFWPQAMAPAIRAEFQRQAAWVQTVTKAGVWFAPELLAAE